MSAQLFREMQATPVAAAPMSGADDDGSDSSTIDLTGASAERSPPIPIPAPTNHTVHSATKAMAPKSNDAAREAFASSSTSTKRKLTSTSSSGPFKKPRNVKKPTENIKQKPQSAPKARAARVSNEWPGLRELVKTTGISSVTTVDPGWKNLAVMRMEFAPTTRITHVSLISIDDLCKECAKEKVLLGGGGTIEARMFALARFVRHEMRQGGCFDSDMLLVEDQSFDRLCARIEAVIVGTFNLDRSPFPLTTRSCIPRAQTIDSRSVKACYRRFFPKYDGTLNTDDGDNLQNDNNIGSRPAAPFGVGNAHGDATRNKQRAENKKNAVAFGSLIFSPQQMVNHVAHISYKESATLTAGQKHDIYDTLFMCLYFASVYLFHFHKVRLGKPDAELPAFEKPKQRKTSKYEEIEDVCSELGTNQDIVESLLDTLLNRNVFDDQE